MKSVLACALSAALVLPTLPVFAGNLHPDGNAKAVAIEAAAEGITLIKNEDNVLPLSKDPTYPVFGQGCITHVPGGGGSGDMNIASTSVHESVLEGMRDAGLKYDDTTLRIYKEDGDPDWYNGGSSRNFANEVALTAEQVAASKESSKSDTALYVLRRGSSEGSDRNATNKEATAGGSSANTTRAATNYELTTVEQNNFDLICEEFDNVVVIMNVVGVTDLSWTENYPQIKGIICPYTPGSYGMIALGQILAGDVNPSGKLVDTWAKSLSDYPARAIEGSTFGTGVQNPVYAEDIYVGYRYFETFAPDRVLYEFGFGLSYTSFDIQTLETKADADNVTVTVKVTNTGKTYSGKEVVQVYYSAPQGVLGKAAKVMGAYAKTKDLAPGESQRLEISFKTNNMASYDDAGLTGNKSCYVLEAGNYDIYVGNSVKNVDKVTTYNVPELKVTEECTEAMTPVANNQGTPFNRLTPDQNEDGTFTANIDQQAPYIEGDEAREARVQERRDTDLPWVELTGEDKGVQYVDVLKEGKDPETGAYNWGDYMAQIPMSELVQIVGNSTTMGTNKTLEDLTDEQRETLLAKYPNPTPAQICVTYYHTLTTVGSAGWFGTRGTDTSALEKYGIPCLATIDGPAGMRTTQNPGEDGNTWFQSGTLRASMWNPEMGEKLGYEIGLEGVINNCDVWLAPGMNIHRDPLCGRNFEYYTEDPLLCGQTAAAETKGVQSAGQAVTLKHFAANQQETSRMGGNSQVSERALREIYLKGFEIAVKTANPYCIMTSYNRINGSYACSNFDLCQTIARDEWGFTGMFMSDWGAGKDAGANFGGLTGNALMLRAGHDIWMSYGNSINRNGNSGAPEAGVYDSSVVYRKDNANGELSYYTKDGDKYLFTVAEADADTTGILRPIVNGQLTMGEFQRAVTNILNLMSKNIYYRTARWDIGLAEYTYSHDSDFTTVTDIGAGPSWRSVLLDMINEAEALVGSEEYNSTYEFIRENLDTAIKNAWAVYNDTSSTVEEITDVWYDLVDAIGYLSAKPADTSKLENLITLAVGLDTTKYNTGVEEFEAALDNAKQVLQAALEDMFASQDEVDQAYNTLLTAIRNMRYTVNKDMLQSLYDEVNGIDTSLYSTASVAAFRSAMAFAETALTNDNATQETVDKAYLDLNNAYAGLELISDPGKDPEKPDDSKPDDNKPDDGKSDDNSSISADNSKKPSSNVAGAGNASTGSTAANSKKKNVNTGDNGSLAILLLIVASAGAVVVTQRKRIRSK